MILLLANKYQKQISLMIFFLMYTELLVSYAVSSRSVQVFHYATNSNRYNISDRSIAINSSERIKNKKSDEFMVLNFNKLNIEYNQFDDEAKIDNSALNVLNGPGPTQPEMQAFQSVNSKNMVDLFSGDFSYNIPLIDVGGYPLSLGYRSGISMDQEASWVGLGWNVNAGTITRNLRGIPDDFDGTDTIVKTNSIKENKTVGGKLGADIELIGVKKTTNGDVTTKDTTRGKGNLSFSLGLFKNSYKGWGMDFTVTPSINAGVKGAGTLTAGLSLSNNTQEGLSISPSLSFSTKEREEVEKFGGSVSMSSTFNTRQGLKNFSFSAGPSWNKAVETKDNKKFNIRQSTGIPSGSISFAYPSYTPSISIPYTSSQFCFTGKLGGELWGLDVGASITGYVSTQKIAREDQVSAKPAYGYLNYEKSLGDPFGLLDYNVEKEIPFREKPEVPIIGIPYYTYDAFSISGEGNGGMFRAYRGDVGFVYDHLMRSKDKSDGGSIDVGLGGYFHGGFDYNFSRSTTQTGPWSSSSNLIADKIRFKNSDSTFEASYFRNPGEMSLNTSSFYDLIAQDSLISFNIYNQNSDLYASPSFSVYQGSEYKWKKDVSKPIYKNQRDKRSQVISYLTADEAESVGVSKFIENYRMNYFDLVNSEYCKLPNLDTPKNGLKATYKGERKRICKWKLFRGTSCVYFDVFDTSRIDSIVLLNPSNSKFRSMIRDKYYNVTWTGRLYVPETGTYRIQTNNDDGARFWIKDSLIINDWKEHPVKLNDTSINLIGERYYDIKVMFRQAGGGYYMDLSWVKPDGTKEIIPKKYLTLTPNFVDTIPVAPGLTLERRKNSFRRSNHISEINVLNADGRRYVYGIPVYNLKQKDITFSVNSDNGCLNTGLVAFNYGLDNTTNNNKGKDNYFFKEEMPAYTHSFLLTGVLSPDYVDLTGDGITDDDLGDAVKFNYTKLCGKLNPFTWRTPFNDSASYSEGYKSYDRDDKGSYVYGEKELWYMHSIVSKTMVATFSLSDRLDQRSISENGLEKLVKSKKLDRIDIYSKAELREKGIKNARPIKTVHFEYSYELCKGVNGKVLGQPTTTGKLTLKKVWFTYNGNNKGKQNPYVFTYHTNNPNYNSKMNDRWGTFKNPIDNPTVSSLKYECRNTTSNCPKIDYITNADYPYSLQDSLTAANNAGAWSLTEIKIPSGGKIKIDYESDEYAFVQNKRAMQMFNIVGFSSTATTAFVPMLHNGSTILNLGGSKDNLYLYAKINNTTSTKEEILNDYLKDYIGGKWSIVDRLFFRLAVYVGNDDHFGCGYENIPCYAYLDKDNPDWFEYLPSQGIIRLKLKGMELKGGGSGNYSPLAKAAIQYMRLNLQSKAYPGSENDGLSTIEAIKMFVNALFGWMGEFQSFPSKARSNFWMSTIDPNRTFVRLFSPEYKKIGGGHRVKRITVFDNWKVMTGNQESEATYGQEYTYTTVKEINGKLREISSGVANYEPIIGNEENPFREPIEYIDQTSVLAPVNLGYIEKPLAEGLLPTPSVGYSKVRVRSIHYKNKKSANGYDETEFYTAYDFPTFSEHSALDKKRYKTSGLQNFFKFNAEHYVAATQGFRVVLNDMHGKMKSQSSYSETDPINYISRTEYFYKTQRNDRGQIELSNKVWTIDDRGNIDTSSTIGLDIEIMPSMKEQATGVYAQNFGANVDVVPGGPFPIPIPSGIPFPQIERTMFRAAAITKVVQRNGIIDSIVQIDKGSRVSTENILYDAENGNVILSRAKNEFNDSVYNFNYPAHWAYEGMSGAYKNIGLVLKKLTIRNGIITDGLPYPGADTVYFSGGDELITLSKPATGNYNSCNPKFSFFNDYFKIWAINVNETNGGEKRIRFVDAEGQPFSGNDLSLKVMRSGRRNIAASVGSITTLKNPVLKNEYNKYVLKFDTSSQIIQANAVEYKNTWSVEDKKKEGSSKVCTTIDTVKKCQDIKQYYLECIDKSRMRVDTPSAIIYSNIVNDHLFYDSILTLRKSCVEGLKYFFQYLIGTNKLFIKEDDGVKVGELVEEAKNMWIEDEGILNTLNNCSILSDNYGKLFFAISTDSSGKLEHYTSQIGSCTVSLVMPSVIYPQFSWNANEGIEYPIVSFDSVTNMLSNIALVYLNNYEGSEQIALGALADNSFNTKAFIVIDSCLSCSRRCDSDSAISCGNFLTSFENTSSSSPWPKGQPTFLRYDNVIRNSIVYSKLWTTYHVGAEYKGINSKSGNYVLRFDSDLHDTCYLITPKFYNASSLSFWIRLANPSISPVPFIVDKSTDAMNWELIDSFDVSTSTFFKKGVNIVSPDTSGQYFRFRIINREKYYMKSTLPAIQLDDLRLDGSLDSCCALPNGGPEPVTSITTCVNNPYCYSPITDTSVNPYMYGLLGNYRANKSYVYFAQRKQQQPNSITNIRTDGAFNEFSPYWQFSGGRLTTFPDTIRWVWNSEILKFNDRGLEVENKDPLGRYNCALYGYGKSLPIAVSQNSRLQESMFDGFEDYNYSRGNRCEELVCEVGRHMNFGFGNNASTFISSEKKHTGRFSLQLDPTVPSRKNLGVTINLSTPVIDNPDLNYVQSQSSCASGKQLLKEISADSTNLIPSFSPTPGTNIVFSVWVMEDTICKCSSYSNNEVVLVFKDSSDNNIGALEGIRLTSQGSIIEGWQRYDSVIFIPANAATMSIMFRSKEGTSNKVYFDDLRIHPYHANMKSFVYNSTNLRLMAELDENNYASFYEYDDEGTLVRVKKETSRGVKTIKETRSALNKE